MITVIGGGAIGGIIGGYLRLKGKDVCLLGRPASVKAIKDNGLTITGIRGEFNVKIEARERLTARPRLAILATKTQDLGQAIDDNISYLKDCPVLTVQNGLQSDVIAARYLPAGNLISGIVMFGATYLAPGKIVHNFAGEIILGGVGGAAATGRDYAWAKETLSGIFPVTDTENIRGMKYLKLFLNANNCLPAILGLSMQEVFADLQISRIALNIWKEGLHIIEASGIILESLPGFPAERISNLVGMPGQEGAKVFSRIMRGLSKDPLDGSILQSIKRGRPSEIDYINGEFVRLAKENNLPAPLNEKMVEMVHYVERQGRFFSKEELVSRA